MLVFDLLREAARRFPDKEAAVFADERITFAALLRTARQVAARLHRLGIGPGRRVALLYDNSPAALAYFWGTLCAGAEVVDLPALAGQAAIGKMLEECRPAALAVGPRQLMRLGIEASSRAPGLLLSTADAAPHAAVGASGRRLVTLEEVRAEESPAACDPTGTADEVAMIIYTSATTGQPKGVMLSHDNVCSNIVAFNSRLGLTPQDSLLVIVPLHFIHGRTQLLTHAMIGGTLFFSAGFQFPKAVLDELQRHQVTGISGVPFHFASLLALSSFNSVSLPHLRNVTITGGAPSLAMLRQLAQALPEVRVHLNYGQTESGPRLTYLGPGEIFERAGSCGRALPGVRLEILGAGGESLPSGVVGEVVAGGAGIMRGYVSGDERASGHIDEHGRLHTGDLGHLDEDGYLHLAGRSSDMIKCAGERIFPREIEEVLDGCAGVCESAVLGLADPVFGEKIVACVVLEPGASLTLAELRTHCLRSLPFVRTPKEMRFLRALPKTSSGKVARAALASAFHEGALAALPAAAPPTLLQTLPAADG
jgi:long-chain acyl-CoA synthetase